MSLWKVLSKERDLSMIWKVLKEKNNSFLVGTAHFFPYSFKKSLIQYISKADIVLLEGPLDEISMETVVKKGYGEAEADLLFKSIDEKTVDKIGELLFPVKAFSSFSLYTENFKDFIDQDFYQFIKEKKAWMVFFTIWSYYRKKRGWIYTMDLDAMNIAKSLNKKINFLETIDEQITALNSIPIERFKIFLEKVDNWDKYIKKFVKYYLNGNLDRLMDIAKDFPTFCESVIQKRDPIIYERMKPFIDNENTIIFVGITHIEGIKRRLIEDGYFISKG